MSPPTDHFGAASARPASASPSVRRTYRKRPAPYSLRLSEAERQALVYRAGRMALGTYIRSVLFADNVPPARRRKAVQVDEKAIAQALAVLGASRLASNLNQLAKAANHGTLYVDLETREELNKACRDIALMRDALFQALGYGARSDAP